MRHADPRTRGGGVGTTHAWIRGNVLGLVAIFIALGGTAVAAQVADEQQAQTAKKGKRGARGPAGPAGPQGLTGLTGSAGPNNVTVVRTTVAVPSAGFGNSGYAICPAGTRATGGGAGWNASASVEDTIVDSGPTDSGASFGGTVTGDVPVRWFAKFYTTGTDTTAYVFAICQ